VVAGRRPVEEAFAARRPALRLLVVPERRAALEQLVLHATTLRIPVVEVEGGTITALSGFDGHQGVALVVAPRRWATLDEALAVAHTRGEPPLLLVLDHLEDPQNVGTLLRSAEAAGVHGVVFPTRGSAPLSPAAIKASAGATEHLQLVPLDDLPAALVDLHTRGLRIVGADGDAPLTVRELDLRGPLAIVIGSEGRGLDGRVRRRVDTLARIPMRGRIASLNASVAGSVFLFEAATQRGLGERAPSVQGDLAAVEGSTEPGLAPPDTSASTFGAVEVADLAEDSAHGAADAEPADAEPAAAEPPDAEPPDAEPPDAEPADDPDALLPEVPSATESPPSID
jgi:23S rRNA (guanosine2251-2'-O)-methyltransferase